MDNTNQRKARDSMGTLGVPAEAYYGASTARAIRNFPISGQGIPQRLIRALGLIKWAAARTNVELGRLDQDLGKAIERAALEVVDGRHDGEFVVDVFQTGSGTSSNMNANEVIANRAAELVGEARDSGAVHPNDHVNLGQSSNDVFPTAIHLAALAALEEDLRPGLSLLLAELQVKAEQTWDTIKTGRTHLQDATPIRMGQVFRGYAGQVERALKRLDWAVDDLSEVALGGTAVGTGVNTHIEFAGRALSAICRRTGLELRETDNHFQAQSSIDALVSASGVVRSVAVALLKIANDLRLLASGPRCGLGELRLPEVQPGSSIMPGKVNPVIAESVVQVSAQVAANDLAVLQAGQWGFFELNTMLPLAGRNLLESIEIMGAATRNLAERCVRGLEATDRGPEQVENGLAIVTGLVPFIGYDRAAEIAKRAADTGRSIREVAAELAEFGSAELDQALEPFSMTAPEG